MTLALTQNARFSAEKLKKEPSIVLEFDGIDQRFGSAVIIRVIRIGDPGLFIGNEWVIGGTVQIENQSDAISFDSAFGQTTTKIDYRLNPDLGVGDSITSMQIALVDDKAKSLLKMLSNDEFLARKCRVYLSPDPTDTNFPEDYIVLFRGIVDDIKLPPGGVVLNISHPDQKKRQDIFISGESALASSVTNSQNTMPLATGDGGAFLTPINAPDGSPDDAFFSYVRIDDEIIRFTGRTGDTLTGCSRAQLGTTAATHDSGAAVKSFYRLNDAPIPLAQKIMLSGWNGPFVEDITITAFRQVRTDLNIENAVLFNNVNVVEAYGLTAGDYIYISDSTDPTNDVSLPIESVVIQPDGSSYLLIDGASFSNELTTSAKAAFRSKYDTLPSGLKMSPDEVDVQEHERLNSLFLSGINFDLYLKDTTDGKKFISDELYKPIACYAVPRKARSSVAFTIGPLPNQFITTINAGNVKNAERISLRRSIGRNFYNTIVYKFDESPLENEFLRGFLLTDTDSREQIKLDTRAFTIITKGLRDGNVIASSATRRLDRYKFAATSLDNIKVTFDVGFNLEIADLVIVDGESLQFANTETGEVGQPPRFYEIITKSIDLQTGDITLGLLDTNFGDAGRYALISPASIIRQGLSNTSYVIESSFASEFGLNEFEKWIPFDNSTIRVRSEDYSISATAAISVIAGNTITVSSSLGFTPSAGMIMEFSDYPQASEQVKLLYAFNSSATGEDFPDGSKTYVMI